MNRTHSWRRFCVGAIASIALPVMIATTGGCQHKADSVPVSSSVTEISAPPAMQSTASYAPVQPVYDSTPVAAPAASTYDVASAASAGGTYKVKKGDTLYGIARAHYGDGKQWQKIASANPGLSPQSLKVGQSITLP